MSDSQATSHMMETITTIEVSVKQPETERFPRQTKCCYCFNLKLGLNLWLVLEASLWLLLFVAAFVHEIYYIEKVELLDFVNESDEWYFHLIFGNGFDYIDQSIRSKELLQQSCVEIT